MSKKNPCCENNGCDNKDNRIGTVGGQAVHEGVMMKAGNRIALSVRTVDGDVITDVDEMTPPGEKCKILKWPLIRGIVNFVTMMKLSMKTLNKSVEMLGIEEEEPTKFEKWLDKHFGKSLVNVATAIGTILGLVLAVFLFMFLPTVTSTAIFGEVQEQWGMRILKSVFSGVFRIAIFLAYIGLVALIPDIKRTFQYHGAEHKSVFCHEKYLELNVENVKAQSRFHPRCGTSFLVVMMILGIFINLFFVNTPVIIQTCLKLVTLPLVVALGYEFIRFAGRHDNIVTRILSAPGLWIQRLTTKEPTDDQIEVAIQSLKAALPETYPEIVEVLEAQKAKEEAEKTADDEQKNEADEESAKENSGENEKE
jgi:uncharacterized protein YqhQ